MRAVTPWPPLLRSLVYGLAGSLLEALFTSSVTSLGARRVEPHGPSTPWMVPIYGLAMPLFEPVHDRIRGRPPWQRGFVYATGILAVEWTSGRLFRRLTGRVPWDYGRAGLSVDGLIRLDYAPLWGALGLATERLHDLMTCRTPQNPPSQEDG